MCITLIKRCNNVLKEYDLKKYLPFLNVVIGDLLSVPLNPWMMITFFFEGSNPEYFKEYLFLMSILSLCCPVSLKIMVFILIPNQFKLS